MDKLGGRDAIKFTGGVAVPNQSQIDEVNKLQKRFNKEMDDFLHRWRDIVKDEISFISMEPGQFILIGAIANVMCHAFGPYNFSNKYIEACIEEHMVWIDRKVKEYGSRN